ncbi:MAG: transaldolase family protein [Collinsella sp.]
MLKIAELCEGLPVSAESTATTAEGMIEGKRLAALAPTSWSSSRLRGGLAACRALADAGVRVNMTLVFSPTQALWPPTPVPLHQPVCGL